jgi:hypothetical protein
MTSFSGKRDILVSGPILAKDCPQFDNVTCGRPSPKRSSVVILPNINMAVPNPTRGGGNSRLFREKAKETLDIRFPAM